MVQDNFKQQSGDLKVTDRLVEAYSAYIKKPKKQGKQQEFIALSIKKRKKERIKKRRYQENKKGQGKYATGRVKDNFQYKMPDFYIIRYKSLKKGRINLP